MFLPFWVRIHLTLQKNTNEYPPFGCAPVFFPITEIVKPSKLKSPKVSKQRKKKK